MRSRIATLLAIAMLSAGAGGTFALAKEDGGKDGSGATTEYKGGKGCGDKNHVQTRSDECKKDDGKGDKGGKGEKDNGKARDALFTRGRRPVFRSGRNRRHRGKPAAHRKFTGLTRAERAASWRR
jgi:hypothetical protein